MCMLIFLIFVPKHTLDCGYLLNKKMYVIKFNGKLSLKTQNTYCELHDHVFVMICRTTLYVIVKVITSLVVFFLFIIFFFLFFIFFIILEPYSTVSKERIVRPISGCYCNYHDHRRK